MPIYEYECGHCRFRFEMKQGFDEEPAAMCPQCQRRVRRVFHSTPVIFRGSGFYITDSRKAKDTEAGKGKEGSAGKEAGKGKEESAGKEAGKGK